MDRVNLIADRPLKYRGQRLQKGDPFTATRAHARALKAIKRASDAPEGFPSDTVPTPEPETYATKDIVAETPEAKAEEPPPKRTYRRRDMTPKT